jgi:hypothetical protein
MKAGKQDCIHKVGAYISFKRNNFDDRKSGEDNYLTNFREIEHQKVNWIR